MLAAKGMVPGEVEVRSFLDGPLSTLDARVRTLAVCNLGENLRRSLGPLDTPLMHYVLSAVGWICSRDQAAKDRKGEPRRDPQGDGSFNFVAPGRGCDSDAFKTYTALPVGMLKFGEADDIVLRTTSADSFNVLGFFVSIEDALIFGPGQIQDLSGLFDEMRAEIKTVRIGAFAVTSAPLKKMPV